MPCSSCSALHGVNLIYKKKKTTTKKVAKVNNIDTSGFVFKKKYYTDKSNLEKKISNDDKKIQMLVDLLKDQITMLRLLK